MMATTGHCLQNMQAQGEDTACPNAQWLCMMTCLPYGLVKELLSMVVSPVYMMAAELLRFRKEVKGNFIEFVCTQSATAIFRQDSPPSLQLNACPLILSPSSPS